MTAINFYAYARHALVDALRISRIQPGDSVLLPDFICRDVFASIRAVGARPATYRIQRDLQPVPGQRLPDARAVIVVNYFGFPADLTSLKLLGVSESTVVIEDNAHGWLSRDQQGRTLGFRTSVGITSFRKTIRSPDGAFLSWSDSPQLDLTQIRNLPKREQAAPVSYRLRAYAQRFQTATGIRTLNASQWLVRNLRRARQQSPISDDPIYEYELPTDVAPHSLSLKMYESVDTNSEIARRRNQYRVANDLAASFGVQSVFPSLTDGVSPQGFPYFGDSEPSDLFEREVKRLQLGSIVRWPSLSDQSGVPHESPLRTVKIVNFLQ
jgi:hypothetical protein